MILFLDFDGLCTLSESAWMVVPFRTRRPITGTRAASWGTTEVKVRPPRWRITPRRYAYHCDAPPGDDPAVLTSGSSGGQAVAGFAAAMRAYCFATGR